MSTKIRKRNKSNRKRNRHNWNEQDKKMTEKVTNYLIKEFKKEGIIIQKYQSKTSLSVYLKLDYGVLNSIRISDHKGEKYLNYRYNVLTICPEPISKINKTPYWNLVKHYFPINRKEDVLKTILKDRNNKISLYGFDRYKKFVNIELARNYNRKGFWQKSQIV